MLGMEEREILRYHLGEDRIIFMQDYIDYCLNVGYVCEVAAWKDLFGASRERVWDSIAGVGKAATDDPEEEMMILEDVIEEAMYELADELGLDVY